MVSSMCVKANFLGKENISLLPCAADIMRRERTSVKKNLFGSTPKDSEKNIAYANEQLEEISRQKSEQWGFDFQEGRMLKDTKKRKHFLVPIGFEESMDELSVRSAEKRRKVEQIARPQVVEKSVVQSPDAAGRSIECSAGTSRGAVVRPVPIDVKKRPSRPVTLVDRSQRKVIEFMQVRKKRPAASSPPPVAKLSRTSSASSPADNSHLLSDASN